MITAYRFSLLAVVCVFFLQPVSGKEPVSYRQSAALSVGERRSLSRKAERGDSNAAFALALYYATVAPDLRKREYFLTLASKDGSRESIESLANFYSMPGGIFRLRKAITLRESLERKFPAEIDNADWAEGCAFEYHYRATEADRRKELIFLRLAESWGSKKAKQALKGISVDRFPVPTGK